MTIRDPRKPKGRPRQHGESIHSKRRIACVERQVKALEMRKAGHTYKDIAAATGVSINMAFYDVEAALKRILSEPGEEVRKLEVERLDRAMLAIWQRCCDGDVRAISTLMQIMGRRAALLGLDAPTRLSLPNSTVATGPAVLVVPGAMNVQEWEEIYRAHHVGRQVVTPPAINGNGHDAVTEDAQQ